MGQDTATAQEIEQQGAEAHQGSKAEMAPSSVDPAVEIERLTGDIWWNHEIVARTLELEADQRARMDAHLRSYLEKRLAREGVGPRPDPFRQALREGDLEAASAGLDATARRLAEASVAEGRMMLAVLAELDAEQLDALRERFPRVLRARWVVFLGEEKRGGRRPVMRPGGPRGDGRRAGGQPAGSVDGPGGMQ